MNKPTFLGTVESASGSAVTVGLHPDTLSGLVYIGGQGHRVGQVGSFVHIPQGLASLYGVVVQAGVGAAPTQEVDASPEGRRWMTVEIVGEGTPGGTFARGVYRYPTIGDEVHLLTESDLALIYGSAKSQEHVEVGRLSTARGIPARVNLNRLISRHSAVVGATGAGKSSTVASLLYRLVDSDRFPAARVVLLDVHGEYSAALRRQARLLAVHPDVSRHEESLSVPYWALTFEELLSVTLGPLDGMPRGWVADWIVREKRAVAREDRFSLSESLISVDTPIPFALRKLWYDLRWEMDATYPRGEEQTRERAAVRDMGDPERLVAARFEPNDGQTYVASRSILNIRRQVDALESRLRDPRLGFLFAPGPWTPGADGLPKEDLDALLAIWLGRGGPGSEPVSVLNLSGVPATVLVELTGAMLRIMFDALFWGRNLAEGGRERPLLIVMEEAHMYLADKNSSAAQAVQRLVKEGRKYGISAMLVSQRPIEIDSTILSQCGTIFALRMGNVQDRAQVAGATSESLRGLTDLLPTLRTGETLIVGEAVQLPTRAMIDRPPVGHRPDSGDPRVVEVIGSKDDAGPGGWDRPLEAADYADLVKTWRSQDPKSPRTVEKE